MLKVLELFSGVGCQTQALKNIGIEHVSTQCDIDKWAVRVYNQIHGETKNLGDIAQVDENTLNEGDYDLITYSSPCQDFSMAGLRRGGEKDSGTRSSLLWEVEKIIKKVKPKYLLMENVKNLVGKEFYPCFRAWLDVLESYGYHNYWDVLDAADYGIPQHRERVFVVSFLDEKKFRFPKKQTLTLRVKDFLEDEVPEKYYLADRYFDKLKWNPILKPRKTLFGITRQTFEPMVCRYSYYEIKVNDKGLSNTLTTVPKDNYLIEPSPKRIAEVPVGKWGARQGFRVYDVNHTSPTLMVNPNAQGLFEIERRIRKLTPRECWRLMGWKDEQFNKIKAPETQLYRQAGNGIVINVLEAIFKQMFEVQ